MIVSQKRNVLLLTVLKSMLPFFSYCWNSQIHSTVVRTLQNVEKSMETYAKTVALCLVYLEGHQAPFTATSLGCAMLLSWVYDISHFWPGPPKWPTSFKEADESELIEYVTSLYTLLISDTKKSAKEVVVHWNQFNSPFSSFRPQKKVCQWLASATIHYQSRVQFPYRDYLFVRSKFTLSFLGNSFLPLSLDIFAVKATNSCWLGSNNSSIKNNKKQVICIIYCTVLTNFLKYEIIFKKL